MWANQKCDRPAKKLPRAEKEGSTDVASDIIVQRKENFSDGNTLLEPCLLLLIPDLSLTYGSRFRGERRAWVARIVLFVVSWVGA
jgi:hypothetical protein